MWEVIKANQRKSWVLFSLMGTVLILLGFVIGASVSPEGGLIGLIIALAIWIIMSFVSYFSGDSIMLRMSGAQLVNHNVHPQLFNIVEEMKIASGMKHMPKVYIIPQEAPNAFATGIHQDQCAVAVTAGLLSRLNRDELQGVIAHEMSHIMNRDVLFMSFAGTLLGSIAIISQVFLRGTYYSSFSSRRYRSSSRNNQGDGVMLIIALAVAILAPVLTQLLYFAISRKREYLADASAVRLTRYPQGLASALEKISSSKLDLTTATKITAPLYIANPLKQKGKKLSDLTSTHPPISERVKILRGMQQGVNLNDYQVSFNKVKGQPELLIPATALKDKDPLSLRQGSSKKKGPISPTQQAREIGDLIRRVNDFLFISCACGLTIKLPANYNRSQVQCPRCQKKYHVQKE